MKRILLLLIILSFLLCGCRSDSDDSLSTPDSFETAVHTKKTPSAAVESKEAATESTERAAEKQLVEKRVNKILNATSVSDNASVPIETIEQYPELPTGCEIVALTMALNCFGYGLDKTDVADNFIEYGDSFVVSYVGDPYSDGGAGIWPPGIIRSVENFSAATGASIYAYDTSHLALSDLYKFIDAGCPVMVWTTYYMDEPMFTDDGEFYGDEFYMWYDNEHCVTLFGYDLSEGTVEIADPLQGAISVDANDFERINRDIGGWSVALLDTSESQTSEKKPAASAKPAAKPTSPATEKPASAEKPRS